MTTMKAHEKVLTLMKVLKDNQNTVDKLSSEKEIKMTKIVSEFTGRMKPFEETIKTAAAELATLCEEHQELFAFGTLVTPYGAVGYRNNPPSVQVDDEDAAISFIEKAKKAIFGTFLKVKTSLDKTSIKKALGDKEVTAVELEKAGIRLVSERVFKYAVDKKSI